MKIKTIKYTAVFLVWMSGMPIWAGMECVDWEMNSSIGLSFQQNPKCFYLTGDMSGDYCISDVSDNPFSVDSNGNYCDPANPAAGGCINVDTVWEYVGSSGGCGMAGNYAMAILPLADALLPFLFFSGAYGLFVYGRLRRKTAA